MSSRPPQRSADTRWRRQLTLAGSCAILGVVFRLVEVHLPVPITMIGLGIGLIASAFMLAWAADAGETVFSGGLVLAAVALAAVLPEFIIEVRLAFIQRAELVTANLTGATRLLLTCATALPLLVALHARRRGENPPPIQLSDKRRVELGLLLAASLFAVQIIIRGSLTVVDGLILLFLYLLYARKVQGTPDEQAGVVGVASGLLTVPTQYRRIVIGALILFGGLVVVVIANPFADALLHTGTLLGIDPYLMIQSVVPAATEAPELVVVAVLVASRRPAQGFAVLLASSLSQWTLGLGALPMAYLAGGGGPSLPLAGREQLEVGLTSALTLFVVAALATLRPARIDAWLVGGVYMTSVIYPTAFVRFAATLVLLIYALDLLFARRQALAPLLRASFGRTRSSQ